MELLCLTFLEEGCWDNISINQKIAVVRALPKLWVLWVIEAPCRNLKIEQIWEIMWVKALKRQTMMKLDQCKNFLRMVQLHLVVSTALVFQIQSKRISYFLMSYLSRNCCLALHREQIKRPYKWICGLSWSIVLILILW